MFASTGWTIVVLALLGPGAPGQVAPRPAPIRTEFRIFDGTAEVTAETRLRVRPTGSTEAGQLVEGAQLMVDLPAGIYDVQAIRQRAGQAANIRWAEKLVVMAYPDEAGRHLEVINFANEHGALQLRWADGQPSDPAGLAVTVARAGENRPTSARLLHGPGYVLLVLPAGAYDVRVTSPGRDPVVLTGVEIPADRTRMKVVQ